MWTAISIYCVWRDALYAHEYNVGWTPFLMKMKLVLYLGNVNRIYRMYCMHCMYCQHAWYFCIVCQKRYFACCVAWSRYLIAYAAWKLINTCSICVLYALHFILCVHLTSSLLYASKAFFFHEFRHFASFKYVLYALYDMHILLLVLYRLDEWFKWFPRFKCHTYLFSCFVGTVCISMNTALYAFCTLFIFLV